MSRAPTATEVLLADPVRIDAAMTMAGRSYSDLERATGIARSTLAKLRSGATNGSLLGHARWCALADALRVDVGAITLRRVLARDARARGAA